MTAQHPNDENVPPAAPKGTSELARTRERLQVALEASGVSVWETDVHTGEVTLSEGWAALLGAPPGKTHTTLKDLMALVHPEDLERLVRLSAETLKGLREQYSEAHRVRTCAGEWRWVLSRGKVLERDAGGRALRMVGTNVDITARMELEAALAESEARFRSLCALSSDWYWEQDEELRFAAFSPGFEEHSHTSRGKLIGKRRWEEPGRRPLSGTWEEHLATLNARRPFYDFECERVGEDGRRQISSISGMPVFNAAGVFTGYRGVSKDITARKLAEVALTESEDRFRTIFERSTAGIALWGADRYCVAANQAYQQFTGYRSEELIGKIRFGELSPPRDSAERDLMQRFLAGEISEVRLDHPFAHKGGSRVWGDVSVSAVRGRDARLQYIVSIVTDITETREARDRVERMNAELEERVAKRTSELSLANKELEAFAYSVSHDLRAPIGALNGFACLLRMNEEKRLSDDGRRLVGFIESNSRRMTELVEGMLSLARIGRQAMTIRHVSMQDLAKNTLAELAGANHAEIRLGAIPDCRGDPLLLRQVLTNLVGNALKYSRGRSPARIEIGYDPDTQAYFVRDNGAGFDMKHAGKLFGAFERMHSETEFEGTGIGLAIVERILLRHGGRVWATSAPGEGATFWFSLPD